MIKVMRITTYNCEKKEFEIVVLLFKYIMGYDVKLNDKCRL